MVLYDIIIHFSIFSILIVYIILKNHQTCYWWNNEMITLSLVLDSNENIHLKRSNYSDITKAKKSKRQSHQQLKENEIKYRALFEQAADGIYLVELNENRFPTRFIDVNPVGCERFGYSREEMLSTPFTEIVSQESTLFIKVVERIREGNHSFTLQDEYIFKSGKKMDVEFSFQVFNLGEKEVFLAISRDITERLKTEELLRKSEKLAVVGQVGAVIAHEIRNPLTTIKGFIQLQKSGDVMINHGYTDVILSEINKIDSITNEFIMIAKPEVSKVQSINLDIFIEQAIILLQPQAMMNNVQIRTEFNSNVPLISCEEKQLKQVFINIFKNAIEAMPSGGEILVQIDQVDDDHACIRFVDQGCGIPKERIPYLGEPFYSIKEKGIGLGLMICYKIIESHQGKIIIESEVGKGTTVDVILPINTS